MAQLLSRSLATITTFTIGLLFANHKIFAQSLPQNWRVSTAYDGRYYQPINLPNNQVFNIWSKPLINIGQLSAQQAFLKTSKMYGLNGIDITGKQLKCNNPEENHGSITQRCTLLSNNQPIINMQYIMLPIRQGMTSFIRVSAADNLSSFTEYKEGLSTAIQLETQYLLQATQTASPNKTTEQIKKPQTEKERIAQQKREEQAKIEQQIHTEPGKGLKSNDYETVLFSWAQEYTMSGTQYEETIYLLMKDGSAYKNAYIPPEDFNIETSKRLQPNRWVKWRKEGKNYQIQHKPNGSWETLQAWPALPGKEGESLNGTFTHSSYANYGGMGGYASTSSFIFKPNGRFEQKGHASFGTGFVQANNGFSSFSSASSSGKGTTSTSTTNATGSTNRRNDGAGNRGMYKINHWTIELHRDNGQVERLLFLFSDEKRNSVNIASTGYLKEKNK